MSKTVELARHLEKLHINNMYKTDFYWTWDKTDDEIDAVFTVADALRDLRERNKCNVTRSVSKMTEIEGRGGKRWDKPKKAGKSRDCRGGKF